MIIVLKPRPMWRGKYLPFQLGVHSIPVYSIIIGVTIDSLIYGVMTAFAEN